MDELKILLQEIDMLRQKNRYRIESWMLAILATFLMVTGIFVLFQTEREMGNNGQHAVIVLKGESVLPLTILACGSFIVLIITLFIAWFEQNRSLWQRRNAQISDRVLRIVGRSQDETIQKVSSWLHDGLGHELILLKMRIEHLVLCGNLSDKRAHELITSVLRIVDEMRDLARTIFPPARKDLGLRTALNQLLENVQKISAMKITQTIDPLDGVLSLDSELLLYRLVQEILTNTMKHTSALTVEVCIKRADHWVVGSVQNDGVVLKTGHLEGSKGIGMRIIQERITCMQGTFNVCCPSEGAWRYRVDFSLPVAECQRSEMHHKSSLRRV